MVLRVRDEGIGISAEMLPRIFEPFAQADQGLARSHGGLGIGLTLVKSLVEMHGGQVTAHSAGAGKGSEFVVRIPLPVEEAGGEEQAAGGAASAGKRKRVLVVDDNVDAAESLAAILRLSGHELRSAYGGPAALEEARSFRPQAVLLDLGLPGLNGYEVARQLRADPLTSACLLVAVSGYGQPEDQARSREAGFNHHLTKPPDLEALGERRLRLARG